MEKQYSTQLFNDIVNHIQDVCRQYPHFNKFVEVSGFISVEMDNVKKERYVLSELIQNSDNVVSESFCMKSLKSQDNEPPSIGSQHIEFDLDTSENRPPRNLKRRHSMEPPYVQQSLSRFDSDFSDPQDNSFVEQGSSSFRKSLHSGEYVTSEPSVSTDIEEVYEVGCDDDDDVEIMPQSSSEGYMSPEQETFSSRGDFPSVPTREQLQYGEKNVHMPQPFSEEYNQEDDSQEDVEVIDLDMFDDPEPPAPNEVSFSGSADGSMSSKARSKLSPGTLSVVRTSVKQFKKFHLDRSGTDVDLLSTSPKTLNTMLLQYFQEGKRSDGQMLTARTLKNVGNHIHMYLRDGGYQYSLQDNHFLSSREYIKKKLSGSGKATPMALKYEPVNDEDIELLFQSKQLGPHSVETLTNTMWFLNSKFFAIRKPAEHVNMKWGDLVLKQDENGIEYIERCINNSFSLKVFANRQMPNRCFVNFYKQYRAMRPKMCHDRNYPFYLKCDRNPGLEFRLQKDPMTYSSFTCYWRKLLVGGGLALNKKIY